MVGNRKKIGVAGANSWERSGAWLNLTLILKDLHRGEPSEALSSGKSRGVWRIQRANVHWDVESGCLARREVSTLPQQHSGSSSFL